MAVFRPMFISLDLPTFPKSLYTQAPYRPYRKSAVALSVIFYYLVFTQHPDRQGQIFSVYRTIWLRQACQTFSGLCGQKRGVAVTNHAAYTLKLHTMHMVQNGGCRYNRICAGQTSPFL
ncbi:hypothetical protein ElyMa_006779300 [Elysia marginata]|uniref:Uncharacterized protein n=1 Tax=Elysia marginata TaxID=1093978 RepID=A0AAV4J1J8_9GAST|nr:hypothetical protein ElyMa_006779300 [Elysia marginata]